MVMHISLDKIFIPTGMVEIVTDAIALWERVEMCTFASICMQLR
jgi:hypothetical protein